MRALRRWYWRVLRELKGCRLVLSRNIFVSGGLALLILLALLVVSCDRGERYEVLKFFFDGVEPPGSQGPDDGILDANYAAMPQVPEGPVWYVHEPTKDCTNCHDTKRQSRFSGRAYLVEPLPLLCYGCHDDFTASAPYVHGPVAVGQCRQCHNPHRTQVKYLLNRPVPDLCYVCHERDSIESIPAHFVPDPNACVDCHDPHSSFERPLLKEGARRLIGDPNQAATISTMVQRQPGRQPTSVKSQEDDPELRKRKQKIADIFYASMNLYRNGRLEEARRGFVAVLESGLIPQAMEAAIRDYISDIDKRLGAGERTEPPDSQR